MSVRIGYQSTKTARLPFHITYRCCHCRAENVDTSQGYTVKKAVTGGDMFKTMERADRAMGEKIAGTLGDLQGAIDQKDYAFLKLHSRCTQCGKAQPWSSFWPVGGTFRLIGRFFQSDADSSVKGFLGFLMMLGSIFAVAGGIRYPVLGIAILCVLFLPTLIALVHNGIIRGQVKKMPPECVPWIQIALPNGR